MALRISINRATRILLSLALLVGVPAESAFAATLAQAAGQERIVWIPRAGTPNGMFTRVCLPDTAAPAPLVVINHGSPPSPTLRPKRKAMPCDGEAARFFTSHGYVAAFPLRRGYGETGGRWAETYGRCNNANYVTAGLATADDIEIAVRYLWSQPYVDNRRTLIVGQSAGGWGTLAFASRSPKGIATFINFAGGRGAANPDKSQGINCSADALVAAAGVYGRTTHEPVLWIYTENDRRIGKTLSTRMYDAYAGAGGSGRFVMLPSFGKDGHNLFEGRGGSAIWGPVVEEWLSAERNNAGRR